MPAPHEKSNVEEETIEELDKAVDELHELSQELGLSPPSVNYWLVNHDEINQLAAYDGFQTRFPHWRWGMKYVERKKKDTFFGGKIFELVNHDNPPSAFLQESNNFEDQTSVIAHVEAHADFFKNNQFFQDEPNAAATLERHANIIESYYEDPSINRNEVEAWIDAILCIRDTIDPLHGPEQIESSANTNNDTEDHSTKKQVEELDVSDEVKKQVFADIREKEEDENLDVEPHSDVLAFLLKYGKQYDEDSERAVDYEDWQHTILELLRREAYYFSAQRMTKIMNEGWAAFWESMMMASECYAKPDEIIQYADKQSKVLNAPGLNPYKIGLEMWQYIENRENRLDVVEKLLRVDSITWRNFHDELDFTHILNILEENRSMDVPYERHYSLLRRQNRGFLKNISKNELQRVSRYMFEQNRYDSVEEALGDIDYESGWKRMREIRETHNDVTFIDSFLTSEFVEQEEYFAYDFNPNSNQNEVSSTDLDGVKKKLLLQMANGGKPTIIAADRNYQNAGELLLKHQYNGVPLDLEQAKEVLKRVFQLWGRPVNLKTIDKDAEGDEQGLIITYDGSRFRNKEISSVEDIRADEIDYDTKPDAWL